MVTGVAYDSLHILALGVMTLVGKSILIPVLMDRFHGAGNTPRIAMRIRPSLTRMLSVVLVVAVSVMVVNFPSYTYHGVDPRYIVVAFSSIAIALLALLNAKSTYSQLFGVLMMENGFSLLIFTLGLELHLFIELGLLMTALLVWYVMHKLSAKLTSVFGEESVDNLNELSE
jgi:hydrogenase-4 membrane subunit HyfE